MKIEIGESLMYSWLKHIQKCQIVQTNWKVSPSWDLYEIEKLAGVMEITKEEFLKQGYDIYKKNNAVNQLLKQAEIDAIGIHYSKEGVKLYCADIAFHENGLNYGLENETISRVIKKIIRTAFCIVGYFGINEGKIYFVSPKISNSLENSLSSMAKKIEEIFKRTDWDFEVNIISNQSFEGQILIPVNKLAKDVADTGELFLRSVQLNNMFPQNTQNREKNKTIAVGNNVPRNDKYSNLRVGQIANQELRNFLAQNTLPGEIIDLLQTKDYSREHFGIHYPLLKKQTDNQASGNEERPDRYYAKPIKIGDHNFYLCSEWYESTANDDRTPLIKWLDENNVD